MPAQKSTLRTYLKSAWPLILGLIGITYSVIGILVLLPPESGQRVNFWLIKFYNSTFPGLIIILPGSILAIIFWFSRFANKSWAKIMLNAIGVTMMCIGIYCSWSILAFMPILSITSEVEKNGQVYYLANAYDDFAFEYYFCESDTIGFSGECTAFTRLPSSSALSRFYVDLSTSLITATFDNPQQTWRMSTQPTHIYQVHSP